MRLRRSAPAFLAFAKVRAYSRPAGASGLRGGDGAQPIGLARPIAPADTTIMSSTAPALNAETSVAVASRGIRLFPWASYAFIAFFICALAAFWPQYLSKLPGGGLYKHLHAVLMTLWFGLLIVQPLLAKTGRFALHRTLGRTSFVVAPLAVLSMLLLTHARIRDFYAVVAKQGLHGSEVAQQIAFYTTLPLAMAALFATAYALAIRHRGQVALHARYMICTGFALVDPVGARLLDFYVSHNLPDWAYQGTTFAVTDLFVVWLIWRERGASRGRAAFPVILAVMVLLQIAIFALSYLPGWQAVITWFGALPIT